MTAFYNCASLKSIVLGEGVTSIGNAAFGKCPIESLTIPDSVQSVGNNIIIGCTSLKNLRIEGGSGNIAILSGMYDIGAGSSLETLTLTNGIKALRDNAFANGSYGHTNLRTVTLPSTVTMMGPNLFKGAPIANLTFNLEVGCYISSSALQGVNLEKLTVNTGNISSQAFMGMTNLKEVHLGSGVRVVESGAFANCVNLANVTMEPGIHTVGSGAFAGCTSLTSLVFPDTMEKYGAGIIEGCKNLTTLSVGSNGREPIKCVSSGLFHTGVTNPFYIGDENNLTRIIISDNVTVIGAYVFANCKSASPTQALASAGFPKLTSISLPSNILEIGSYAFCNMKGLQELSVNNGAVLGGNMFTGSSIRKITVHGETVPANAFADCTTLQEIVIGDDVKTIGEYAFKNCTGLKRLTFPDSVTSYGYHMIIGCTNLEYLRIGGGQATLKRSNGYNPFYIGANSRLKTLVLGEGITSVESNLFINASYTQSTCYFPNLVTVKLPDSLQSLGNGNLNGWASHGLVRTLRMPSRLTGLTENGTLPSDLTIYSDGQSDLLAAFAQKKGIGYVVGGSEVYPTFTLRFVVPGWSMNIRGLTVSDGTIVVTRGTEGEAALLPEGYAILSETQNAYLGTVETEDVPMLAGYTFLGWYTDPDFLQPWTEDMTMPSFDLTLYAKVVAPIPVIYAINADVGEADESLPEGFTRYAADAVSYESEAILPELPELEGRYFTGWFTDPNGVIPWVNAPVTEPITLYAVFRDMTAVRYALDGASFGTEDETLPAGFSLYAYFTAKPGDSLPMPQDPAFDNYTFINWYLDEAMIADALPDVTPLDDVTYFGHMERSTVSAVYRNVEDGLELTRYVPQEDDGSEVHLPSRVGGVPVVSIADGAFEDSGVTTLYLPSSLKRVHPEAFYRSGIKSVNISKGAENFASENGVLYNADRTVLIAYPMDRQSPSYAPAATTERIGRRAFAENAYLKHVTFPDGFFEIGEEAFANCTALTEAHLPDSVTTLRLNAFFGCNAMTAFSAFGLVTIEQGETEGNAPRTTIPMNVKATGPIAAGVLRDYFLMDDGMGGYIAYNYNQRLITLHLEGEANRTVGSEAGVPLGAYLKNVGLSDGSVIYEWYRDSACTQIWNMDTDLMPDADIHLYAERTRPFDYVLGTVTDADGAETEGAILTACRIRGNTVTVPAVYMDAPVVGLSEEFFESLAEADSVSIPGSVVSIAEGVSYSGVIRCDMDSYARIWAEDLGIETDIRIYRLTYVTGGLPISPVEAGKGFSILLPTPSHGARVFDGWYLDDAFTLSAQTDSDGLFTMPGADTVLYAAWAGTDEIVPYTYELNGVGVTVTGYTGSATRIAVPETINGWTVNKIAGNAFAQNALLNEITLPETVQSIGDRAFAECVGLSVFRIPDAVTGLGSGAFDGCSSLKTLNVGAGVSALDPYTVKNCARLSEVNVAAENPALKSVNGVVFSKDGAKLILYPAARAGAYAIPDGVTAIGDGAFMDAVGLTEITVPESVTAVGNAAFSNTALNSVSLPGVKTVGESAFRSCTKLQNVTFGEDLESLGIFAFLSDSRLCRVALPSGLILSPNVPIFGVAENLIIVGSFDSSAYLYAKQNGIPFEDPNVPQVLEIIVTPEELVLERGESQTLDISFVPENVEFGTGLRWSSSNPNVAIIDDDGTVRAIGGGTATLTAVSDNGLSVRVPVEVTVAVQEISLAPIEGEQPRGSSVSGGVTILPASATDRSVVWTSADELVAMVDENGLITFTGEGQTTVTAAAHNGLTAEISVFVYNPLTSLTIDETELELFAIEGRNTAQLNALIQPEDATYTDITWESDNACVTVDEFGLVTAICPGTANVTATSNDPSRAEASVTVTVNALDISGIELAECPSVVYDGCEHIPEIELVADGQTLRPGVDYVMSGETVNAGDNVITVTGIGAYCGEITFVQTIERAKARIDWIAGSMLWPDTLYRAVSVTPACAAYEYAFFKDGAAVDVPVEDGVYAVTVTVPETENYDGATLNETFEFVSAEEIRTLSELTAEVGQSLTLPADARLEYVSDPVFRIVPEDDAIAQASGLRVTAIQPGTCALYVTAEGSDAQAVCLFTVVESFRKAKLPAALTEIDEEAFSGNAMFECVVMSVGVQSVGNHAFADMPALRQIAIPKSVTQIAEDAFSGTNAVFVVEAGSYAEAFAKAHMIPFVYNK